MLGPLYYQKDMKKFKECILEIENLIKQEAIKIYTEKNAVKFLQGTDRLPDYLRAYIESMKKQTEDFRISSCRELRESVNENLIDFSFILK